MVTMATYDHGMVVILYLVLVMWMVLAHHLHDGLYGHRGFGCTLLKCLIQLLQWCRHAAHSHMLTFMHLCAHTYK